MLHDVQVQKKTKYGCVHIEVLPPERCLVARSTKGRSVIKSDFFEYWERKSLSDLRSMGFQVDDDIHDTDDKSEFTLEDNARDQYSERFDVDEGQSTDPAMRKVTVRMVWIKHDYDGDGLAEYRYVVAVGSTILANEECSGIPVACIVPTPLSHRHPGLSVADMVMDIQYIKSMLQRQILNNIYLTNNPRSAISDKVNLDDMLTDRVGGLVRVEGIPSQHIMPLVTPFMGPQALTVIEHLDQVKENRTGTNRYFSGTDQGSLNKTATGIAQLTSSAAQRVEMIGRVMAEGVKELFQVVHELTLKHATQPEKVQLRNEWVTVDPRAWAKRTDMTLAVGLGTGNKEVVANNLMNIMKTQMAILQVPPTPAAKGIQETARQLAKAYGFANPELFFPDVPAQPPVDPKQIQAAMQQLQQIQQQIEEGKKKIDQDKQQLERQAMDLHVEKIAFDADKHVAQHEASFREKKISMAAKEAGTDENGEDPVNGQFEALAQAMMQLAQMMEQTLKVVSAPKVLKRLPDGTKTAVPLLN
jgi:hypothetical protein